VKSCSRLLLARVFGCSVYYHAMEDKLEPRARKRVFVGFKKSVKGYKIWNLKGKKIILSRDVTFDEASMVKPTSSQQVESEKTNMISQQVESDATLPPPDRTISFEITPEAWFKVSVSAVDSAGTETDRSRRLRSDSDDTRKTLHKTPKDYKKIMTNRKKM